MPHLFLYLVTLKGLPCIWSDFAAASTRVTQHSDQGLEQHSALFAPLKRYIKSAEETCIASTLQEVCMRRSTGLEALLAIKKIEQERHSITLSRRGEGGTQLSVPGSNVSCPLNRELQEVVSRCEAAKTACGHVLQRVHRQYKSGGRQLLQPQKTKGQVHLNSSYERKALCCWRQRQMQLLSGQT